MNLYFAPLEGITGHVYRNAHHEFFSGVDRYYAPFISPAKKRGFRTREKKDVLPENNKGIVLIPQILTNDAEDFILVAQRLKELGYKEVNLNLGCPARTVVCRGKGSGFLEKTEELNLFLERIFSAGILDISVKTRLGMTEGEEFYRILDIYNQYPIKELIIHPRVQADFYKNKPNLTVFRDAMLTSRNPVCYNGDINSVEAYKQIISEFPETKRVMLGRGLLSKPYLSEQIKETNENRGEDNWKEKLRAFHDRIYEEYQKELCGYHTVLHKMKEIWIYMVSGFYGKGMDEERKHSIEKAAKKIKKAERREDYEQAVNQLFRI